MSKNKIERILIKLSGESLMGKKNYGIEVKTVDRLAKDLGLLKNNKIEICIVIGGGNIFRGLAASENGMDRTNADYMGMLATVMNGLALQNALEKINIETRVMSAFPMQSICEMYIRRRAIRHIEKNRIVIFAAGTGNPFFTTDTAASLRASEMKCDFLLKATKVDGIYDSDPFKNSKAKKFDELSYDDVISKNLKVMDITAVTLAKENKIPIVVFSILQKDSLIEIINGNGSFTIIKG